MNPLPGLIQVFSSFWLWSVVGLLSLAFSWLVNDALGKKLNRRQLSRLLRRCRYAVLYHELLQAALARTDRWLTPEIGPTPEARDAEGRRAWSWPLFDFSLRLAFAYPIVALLISWAVLGTEGKLGNLVVLPLAQSNVRGSVLAFLVLITWLLYRFTNPQLKIDLKSKVLLLIFIAIWVAGILTISYSLGVVPAGLVAALCYVILAFRFTINGFLIGLFAIYLIAWPLIRAYFYSLISLLFASVILGIISLVSFHAFSFFRMRTKVSLLGFGGFVGLLLGALASAVAFSVEINLERATSVVFFGVLPLLNAVFDFLSIGLTRFLLRRGAVSVGFGALGWALGDLASALGFFALLGLALVTMVHCLNEVGVAPLLDLAALFADIRADPGAYWWLYVTIFSTLLPTLLHLVLASFSALLAIMPEGMALFIRRQLPRIKTDAVAKALTFWTLSTIGFLAIAAVAFGLYGLVIGVLAAFPYAGDWYLYAFERYAAWLGAPVVPVRPGWL